MLTPGADRMLAREDSIGELDRDVLRLAEGFAGAQLRERSGGVGSRSRGAGPVARRAQDRPNLG